MKLTSTALYRHYDNNNNLLYAGISISAINRLTQHKKSAQWVKDAVHMKTQWFDSRHEAQIAEIFAIKTEKPKFNIRHVKEKKEKQMRNMIIKSLYLDEDLIKKIEALAQRNNRRWSDYVRIILIDYLNNLPDNFLKK